MLMSAELINDNGISSIALAFFTALFTAISVLLAQVFKVKNEAREAAKNASKASLEAQKASENTANVSNGFASGVGRKLDYLVTEVSRIREIQDKNVAQLTKHLEWHLDKESEK